MPLTPNEVTDDKSVDEGSQPTKATACAWVQDRQSKAEQRLTEWYESARTDYGFYETKQWSDEDKTKLEGERRVAVTFNRVAPIINSICGQEVSNRQEVRFLPRRVGEVSVADPMNDAVKWLRDNCNAEDEDSDAFKDMTICGMGWTVSRMDYEENPEGDGKVERRDPLLMRWDPAARRKNLADKKWVQADYWMTKEDIEQRWHDVDLSALVDLRSPNEKQTPHDSTENWKYKNNAAGKDHFSGQWRVIHHVERFTRTMHRVLDPATQQIQTYSKAEFKTIKERAEKIGLPLQSNPVQQRYYWEAWTVGDVVLACGEAKVQKDFQYQCMTCFRERETGFWFGLVRLMLDPQRYANRMASLMMSILATGAKGGFLFETGAFVNPKKAKQDWARTDSAIELTEGALAAGKVKAKDPVQLPTGAADLMQFAITSIRDVTGANVEMLGMRQEDQPGVVEDMRTKAGLTILAGVFDAMRLYRKRQGIVLAEFVTKFLSDGRLIRIWGPEGQRFIPLVRTPDAVEYDTVVDESPASRDVKEKTWMVLQAIVPGMMQMGVQIPPQTLDYLPIPESLAMEFKKNLLKKMQEPAQPPIELQKIQMKAQADEHMAQVKAQAAAMIEQARVQADVQIANMEARIKATTEAVRDSSQLELERAKSAMNTQTEIVKALIAAMSKVAAAEVTASKDTDEEGRSFTKASSYPQ